MVGGLYWAHLYITDVQLKFDPHSLSLDLGVAIQTLIQPVESSFVYLSDLLRLLLPNLR